MSGKGIKVSSSRHSTRLKNKPVTVPVNCHEEQEQFVNYKQKKKRLKITQPVDVNEIEVLAEKVAPVFLQSKRKTATKAMKKAKQEFLQSSIPQTLKQQVTLQSALEQREVEIFPRVSHVIQLDTQHFLSSSNTTWLNSLIKPKVEKWIPKITVFSLNLNMSTESSAIPYDKNYLFNGQNLEWPQCKEWIRHFKEDKLISFPFFRSLRKLLPKGLTTEEHQWNDVCGTKHWNENLSNNSAIQQLKQWLKQWKLRAVDVVDTSVKKNFKAATAKRKRTNSDDLNERSSSPEWNDPELLCNTMLIAGPAGCGKTASIYALAEELGFNVLEVNASSRRNGKSVLSQLHEATQSHTVSNNSGGSNLNTFFRPTAAAPKKNEPQTAFSLILFEDVDIVFESEDESFYSALSTLMNNSKRPIILTVTCSNESALTPVVNRIKRPFETLHYKSPELTPICGLMWSLLLAEGYPLQWDNLQNFVNSLRPSTDHLDLRCLLLNLQFRLYHHPLRMKLNFNQLHLSNRKAPVSNGVKPTVSGPKKSNEIRFIELPCHSAIELWSVLPLKKLPRFIYSEEEGFVKTDHKAQLRCGKQSNNSMRYPSPATGDLNNLIHCLDFRAFVDISSSFRSKSCSLSLNDSNHLEDMEELIMKRCSNLWISELEHHNITDAIQPRQHRAATDVLLEEHLPRRIILNRSASSNDILPYTRSICRSEFAHSISKRRRGANAKSSFRFRLPVSDVALSSNVVLDLVNAL